MKGHIMITKQSGWSVLLIFAMLFLLLPGCKGTDTSTDPVEEEDPVVLPTSANELVAAYGEAWRSQDLAAYEAIMSADFKFVMLPETVMEIGADQDYLSRDEDLHSSENMFSTVSDIAMILNGQGHWEAEDETHEHFAGDLRRVFSLHAEILDPNTGTRYIVDGLVTFYAASRDTTIDNEQVTHWYLAGQHDHTVTKATAQSTFGSIKSLYL